MLLAQLVTRLQVVKFSCQQNYTLIVAVTVVQNENICMNTVYQVEHFMHHKLVSFSHMQYCKVYDSYQNDFVACFSVLATVAFAFLLLPMCQYILRPCYNNNKYVLLKIVSHHLQHFFQFLAQLMSVQQLLSVIKALVK